MTVLLAFRFLAGRYHATPFGHHVNEGLIEWPPSPWRLLRALISVGYTSGIWDEAGPPGVGRNLIEKLSCEPPSYYLPDVIGTHSRHYMPTARLDNKGKEKTTLVFDTWAQIEDENQELVVIWNHVTLNDAELSMLNALVERLNYLGRSESWVEGRLMENSETIPEINCFAERQGETPDRNWEQVAILASENVETYNKWRRDCLEDKLAHLPLPTGRKPSKRLLRDRKKIEDIYPKDLLDCLQKDTTWLRSHGWSRPPGSRRVFYWRRSDAISISPGKIKAIVGRSEQRIQGMLLSLTNASRNDHALPPVTRTLPQAELLHRALICIAAKATEDVPQELTGRNETGKPLQGAHEHVHISPLDLDADGHLDHILVWTTSSLGPKTQAAIRAVRKTFTKGSAESLRLALAAAGDFQSLTMLVDEYGRDQGQRIARLTEPTSTWQSVTPFVPPRYIKVRGKNSLEGQIRTELSTRGFPNPVSVIILAPLTEGQSPASERGTSEENATTIWNHFRHFKLTRQRGPQPPTTCGFAIRLEFQHPVPGPIGIGYGSHFGLGLFEHCGNGEG